jgi:ribonuclease Y
MGLSAIYVINFAITLIAAGAVFAYWAANRKRIAAETVGRAEDQAQRLLKDAERESETRKKEALLEAKEKAHEMRTEAERQARDRANQLSEGEEQLKRRETSLTDKLSTVERKEKDLQAKLQAIDARDKSTAAAAAKYEQLVAAQQHELERLSGLTTEEAKDLLLKHIEADARRDAANLVKRLEAEAREQAASKARQFITEAIQRSAAEHTIETTVSVVDLPSDDLKGRIIGREGRNIRALEQATGVDLIVDDTPGAIILSGFDPYRREIAKQAIERLIADGRIHPARIEEVVEKVKTEMEESVRKDGEAAAFELGMHDLHPELQKLMGRLKYRTSYGQNVLAHSIETARLAGMLAAEVGANVADAKKGGLLHDIGKAVDHEVEGPHAQIGADIAARHGVAPVVTNAIAAHHQEVDQESVEATVVQIADAISASRPGARGEALDSYIKRLDDLQQIALSFPGVERCYAIQAGREVRILVSPEEVDDVSSSRLARDVVRKIEEQLQYPGQIKVTVIRETRAVDYAR